MERAGLTCRSRTDRVFDESDYRYDKIGLSLVIDPITGVQQLPFHDETLVIDIGKAQTATSRGQDVKVAYTIFFGPECMYNQSDRLPRDFEQNHQLADLFATLTAVHIIPTIVGLPKINTIIFKTNGPNNNPCFHDHITDNVWRWAENEYKNSKQKPVAFGTFYKELHEILLNMRKRGTVVKFWKVDRSENMVVEGLAKSVLRMK